MNRELGFSYSLLNDSYAAGSATLCVGALMFIPVALKFGRRLVYVTSLIFQVCVSVWAAKLQTSADLIMVNALNCLFGALAEVIVQMTIADVFFIHQRGRMNSIYVWVMIVGCSLPPLAAGFITSSQGWRWVWWWMVILFGISLILFFFLYEDTKFIDSMTGIPHDEQVSSDDKNVNMNEKSSSGDTVSQNDDADDMLKSPMTFPVTEIMIDNSIPRKTYLQRLSLWTNTPGEWRYYLHRMYMPIVALVTFPAACYVAVLNGLVTAAWQIMITVVSSYMAEPPYNFNSTQIGLMSLAPFIGNTLSSIFFGPLSDWLILRLAKKNNGIFEPEMRLWTLLVTAPLVPAGCLIFGYGLNSEASWIVVAVGYAIYGFGMAPVSSAALTYLTDAYTNVSLHILEMYNLTIHTNKNHRLLLTHLSE